MYIKVSMNIKEIITKYPETKAVFENQGIQGLEEEKVLQILEAYPLSEIMKLKKMDASAFVNHLEESIKATRETSDITMKKEEKKKMPYPYWDCYPALFVFLYWKDFKTSCKHILT